MPNRQPVLNTDGPPRALLITGIVVAVVAVVAVFAVALVRQRAERAAPGVVVIAAAPAPAADSAPCRSLMAALPARVGEYQRAQAAQPAPVGAAAWQATTDDSAPPGDPVVLRCGLGRPAEFVVGSPLQVVDSVQWFQVADGSTDRSTWFAVDRGVYVALTLPAGSGPTPIQELSETIGAMLPQQPLDPGRPG